MRLGVSSYTFGWSVGVAGHVPPQPMSVRELLDFAHTQGISVVQVCDNLPLIELPEAELLNVIAQARDQGITLELGTRGLTAENLRTHISLAERLGAPLLRFVMDAPDYHPTAGEAAKVLADALLRLSDTELVVGIENHDRFPARILRVLVDDLDNPQIGICLDTANSLGAGEGLEQVLGYLAPVTVNLHIKDFHIERVPYLQGFTVSGRPAGQGMLNVPDVLEQVRLYGRCPSAILELWVSPEGSIQATVAKEWEWARESLNYLRPLFSPTALV